jgi:hypothetical protein
MKIEKLQEIASQKGYKINDQFFVAYEGNSQFDSLNEDYKDCLEYIKNGGIVLPEFTPQEALERAKASKINELKANFEIASKKPHELKSVKQIDKNGKVIGTVDAYYNIADVNSLNDSVNIIFAGTFIKMQAFLKVLCGTLKAICETIAKTSGKDYKDIIAQFDYSSILTQVNGLSNSPAHAQGANIPYTTKDTKGNEIRVLLSFAKIEEIFAHIFLRVANVASSYNIIEEQIKKASTPEELEKININIL